MNVEGKDPEEFTEDIKNKTVTVKKKMRIRGINKKPTVLEKIDEDNNEETRAGGFNASLSRGQPFKPRRTVGLSPFKNVVSNLDGPHVEVSHDLSPRDLSEIDDS